MATKYIDVSATGSANGTSWANAWTSLSQASGLVAGDIVYISGGPSGQTRTYPLSSTWTPAGGTASSPITYQIGQDSAHNGTAVFTNSGASYWLSRTSNLVISGDAGDGQRHFRPQGWGLIIYSDNGSAVSNGNTRLSYIDFGNNGTSWRAIDIRGADNFELDHCYCKLVNPVGEAFIFCSCRGGYDNNRFHHNTLYAPYKSGGGIGADIFEVVGTGYSIYDNFVSGYLMNYTGGEHQDGWQALGGQYIKIYNNTWVNISNYAIYAANFGSFRNMRIYNNLVLILDAQLRPTPAPQGISLGPNIDQVMTFDDILIANNLVYGYAGHAAIAFSNAGKSAQSVFTNCAIRNNVIVNGGGILTTGAPAIVVSNNAFINNSQANSYFVNHSTDSLTNDYHLTAAATLLINQGVNLVSSGHVILDKDGNSRPSTGAWDIGAYEYGGVPPPPPPPPPSTPVIEVTPTSLSFGSIRVGGSITRTVTVRNTGTANLTGTASTPVNYRIVSGGSYTLPPNASQDVVIAFEPTVKGNHNANASFTGAAGATVALSGISYPVLNSPFAADAGVVTSPFVASSGNLSQPSEVTSPASGGRVSYGINVPATADYTVSALVNAPNGSSNSFWINFDSEPTDPTMVWDIVQFTTPTGLESRTASWRGTGTFDNPQFSPKVWTLTAGFHELIIRGREANTILSTVSIPAPSSSPTIPPNPAPPASPSPAHNATAISINTSLTWNEPTAGTYFNVALGTTTPPSTVKPNHLTTTYTPTAVLQYSTLYYWQISARQNWSSQGQSGTVSTDGPIWSFTTAPLAPPPPPPNQPPTASITSNISTGVGPLTVQFTLNSSDPDGTVASGVLNYGDGGAAVPISSPGASIVRSHTYATVTTQTTYNATWQVTDNSGATSPVVTRNITVSSAPPPPPPAQPPLAGISASPTAGAGPFQVTFTLTSSDPDGTVVSGVLNYGDGGSVTVSSPAASITRTHTYAAIPVTTTYAATWKTTDNSALQSGTASVNIVVSAVSVPPVAILTLPAEGTTYAAAPATVNFTAVAGGGTSPIAKVEFYIDGVKVGEDLTSPYAYSQAGVAAGNHTLTAKALDNQGTPLTGTSPVINIHVLAAGMAVVPRIIMVNVT